MLGQETEATTFALSQRCLEGIELVKKALGYDRAVLELTIEEEAEGVDDVDVDDVLASILIHADIAHDQHVDITVNGAVTACG